MARYALAASITHKPSGRRYWYDYRDSWGHRYYSFDQGATWHRTKTAAFGAASTSGTLRERTA